MARKNKQDKLRPINHLFSFSLFFFCLVGVCAAFSTLLTFKQPRTLLRPRTRSFTSWDTIRKPAGWLPHREKFESGPLIRYTHTLTAVVSLMTMTIMVMTVRASNLVDKSPSSSHIQKQLVSSWRLDIDPRRSSRVEHLLSFLFCFFLADARRPDCPS